MDTCEGHLVPPISSEVTIDGGEVYQSRDEDEEEDNDDGKRAHTVAQLLYSICEFD